jgi:hypothetical protein
MSMFHSTNKKLLAKDAQYWISSLIHLYDCYKTTGTATEDEVALRGFCLSRIAGLAYALMCHATDGCQQLLGDDENNANVKASVAAAERVYVGSSHYMDKLHKKAKKEAN